MAQQRENQDFWRRQKTAKSYVDAPAARAEMLLDIIRTLDLEGGCIMEIGCNAGRNLAALWQAGYHDLAGIEINPAAVRMFRETFPECAAVPMSANAVEDVIRELPDGWYDCVFTMAVLLHLRPESEWVFAEMARISARYVITIECENSEIKNAAGVQRHWARNYQEIFESLGFRQVHLMNGLGDLTKYIVRVFEKV
jgi:SAM-dependent methyltransferase